LLVSLVSALVLVLAAACGPGAAFAQSPSPAPPSAASAPAASGFPGDLGRPLNGMPLPPGPKPPRPPPRPLPKGPPLALSLEAAKAIVAACKGYHVSVSIIDSSGTPKLYYVPDGTDGSHAYTGFRKAYTALSFNMPTSAVGKLASSDAAVAARIKADVNLLSFAGGLLLRADGQVIGALGVSGAEPSEKDEQCGLAGIDKIAARLTRNTPAGP
jgi:uncharacterized protein GlcG (DUF336 family)